MRVAMGRSYRLVSYVLVPLSMTSTMVTWIASCLNMNKPLLMSVDLLLALVNAWSLVSWMVWLMLRRWALALLRNHGTVISAMGIMYYFGPASAQVRVYWDGELAGRPDAGVCLTVDTYWWVSMRLPARTPIQLMDTVVLRDMLMTGQDVRVYLQLMHGATVFEVRELTTGERL